ncbi:hypothetical protein ACFQ77_21920 [Streptomyces virginiae]|uniref:hypothetical protein n=1 Tax=Streptomyces virginiae TaxID=1961 RepID=UPI0036B515BF
MAINHAERQRMQEAAEELLRQRYGAGRSYADPLRLLQDVRSAALGYSAAPDGEAPDVPAEDFLAALTQVEDARARMDALEQDLIRGARDRGASWQRIADSLGMANRQAAEARATRLERAAQSRNGDRDVRAQRRERARRRAVETWCRTHEGRLRTAGEHMVDGGDAWPQLAGDAIAEYTLDRLRGTLEAGGAGVEIAVYLEALYSRLTPYGQPPLEPSGERAAAARAARDVLLVLLDELSAARLAVDEVQLSTKR